MNRRLFISFSGGRTSAFMSWWLTHDARDHWDEVAVVFANTGAEHPKTYEFIEKCDKHFGLNVVWVEAVVHHGERKGTTHRVVTPSQAVKDLHAPEPFEEMIRKYGIPNKSFPHCTRELKLRPMVSYVERELGWERGSYQTAIGIRQDECDRMSMDAIDNKGVIYPLVASSKWPSIAMTKQSINTWWRDQPFDLEIDDMHGNCVFCWKKSFRKLLALMKEDPAVFEFPARMEREHPFTGPTPDGLPRTFFRTRKSTVDLVDMLKRRTADMFDPNPDFDELLDVAGACSESCEVFADPELQ